LIAAAAAIESQASDIEKTVFEMRRQAAELRAAAESEPLPTLLSIREASQVTGLTEWAIKKLLDAKTLGEVRVGDRRFVQTVTLDALAGAA
jgi:hypothetical protein